jgi:hypothetical protein
MKFLCPFNFSERKQGCVTDSFYSTDFYSFQPINNPVGNSAHTYSVPSSYFLLGIKFYIIILYQKILFDKQVILFEE